MFKFIMEDTVNLWRKITKDVKINKPLIPLKIVLFLYYGGWSLYFPYLTLHMVQVGLSIEDIAIIYAVLPFVSFLGPPVAGLLADKLGNYKIVLVLAVIFSALFHTSLLYINPQNGNFNPLALTEEISNPRLFCDPSAFGIQWSCNSSASWNISKASVSMIPFHCNYSCQNPEFQLCYSARNCSSFHPHSMFSLDLDLIIETSSVKSREVCEGSVGDTFSELYPDQPGMLFCNCGISCPVNITSFRRDGTNADGTLPISRMKFWIYFALRIFASLSLGTSLSMLDASTIWMVRKHCASLGKQRICGAVGQVVFGLVAGGLLDYMVRTKGFQDFSAIFYLGDAIFALVVILVLRLDVSVEKVKGNIFNNVKRLARLEDVMIFLVMMLFLGAFWGFLESFYFVFLKEIQAESYLLGMTIALGCMAGLPVLYIADSVVKRIGEVNVIVLAFITYGVRFLAYSFIWNPWLCLPFEICEAVTIHLMGVASAIYCATAAPPGLLATLNGAVGSFHYSFGRGLGSFVGGTFMSHYGTRTTFQIFGTTSGIIGIFYFLLYRFHLRKLEALRTRRKSEFLEASGITPEALEALEPMVIPQDELLARRMSCF